MGCALYFRMDRQAGWLAAASSSNSGDSTASGARKRNYEALVVWNGRHADRLAAAEAETAGTAFQQTCTMACGRKRAHEGQGRRTNAVTQPLLVGRCRLKPDLPWNGSYSVAGGLSGGEATSATAACAMLGCSACAAGIQRRPAAACFISVRRPQRSLSSEVWRWLPPGWSVAHGVLQGSGGDACRRLRDSNDTIRFLLLAPGFSRSRQCTLTCVGRTAFTIALRRVLCECPLLT